MTREGKRRKLREDSSKPPHMPSSAGTSDMECLFTRNWHTSVRRLNEELLASETSYVDTAREACARLRVGVADFVIREAEWEVQRPVVPGAGRLQPIPVLKGKDAYFNSGPALRELAAVTGDPLLVPLFAETVKGVIQAETFLWKERGHSTPESYERHWEDAYKDACRYYSHLDRVRQAWFQFVGETQREGNLFVRFKNQTLYVCGNGEFLLTGLLSDSFHEMSIRISLNRELVVKKAGGVLLRVPDAVCKESTDFLQELVGVELKGISKKEMAGHLGKGQGCVHLIDLTFDAAQILTSL
jgi:hypothetical protein